MIKIVQTNEGIDEQGFRYYARREGFANLASDIKELAVIIKRRQCNYNPTEKTKYKQPFSEIKEVFCRSSSRPKNFMPNCTQLPDSIGGTKTIKLFFLKSTFTYRKLNN